ncbi:DUF6527 family protein [Roseovarius sp. THAF27]|uniref:DUF6527 family protein n=1 Tax=Roseovarius sp. THAF27 TaxID=2587850 RepID=UPI0034A21CA6
MALTKWASFHCPGGCGETIKLSLNKNRKPSCMCSDNRANDNDGTASDHFGYSLYQRRQASWEPRGQPVTSRSFCPLPASARTRSALSLRHG